jgi:hypothetical protein
MMMNLSPSSSMASIQPLIPLLLLPSPYVTKKHPSMIFNLNFLATKSYSKINSTTMLLRLAPLPSMLTAPNLPTVTTPPSENQDSFPNHLVSTPQPVSQSLFLSQALATNLLLHSSTILARSAAKPALCLGLLPYQGRHPPMQLAAMTAQANEEFATQDWLADSGENTHVIADSFNLTNPQPFDGLDTVGVGNGAGLHIQQI